MTMFLKTEDIIKIANEQGIEYETVLIYLDNEGRQKTKFTKSNYLLLSICLVDKDEKIVKIVDVNEKKIIGKNPQKEFDNEQFIKIQIFKTLEKFNNYDFYKQLAYKVNDNEAIKLNLLTKMKQLKQRKIEKDFLFSQ